MSRTAIAALSFLSASVALGCSCAPPTPVCAVYWTTPSVFLGHVVRIDHTFDQLLRAHMIGPGKNLVHFEVAATYRGTAAKELIVNTSNQSSACGYPFEEGHDYLVYASPYQGELTAGACTRTHEVTDAANDADIRWIASLTSLSSGASIFGFIRNIERNTTGSYNSTGLADIPVTITGSQSKTVLSDSEGNFKAEGLAPGKYTVTAEAPKQYAPFMKSTVTVQERGCAEVPMATRLDGHIRGHLFFGDGTPAAGVYLTVKVADTQPNQKWTPGVASMLSGADGAFDFGQLPPGNYIYGANFDFSSQNGLPYYRKAYFPGTFNRSEAAVVAVTAGQIVQDQRFFLPPDSAKPSVPLQVIVRESDGKPVPHAQVMAADDIWENSVIPVSTAANASGEATLTLRPATHYDVTAFANRPDSKQSCAGPVAIDVKEDHPTPVVLVLSHPFGNCMQFKKPR